MAAPEQRRDNDHLSRLRVNLPSVKANSGLVTGVEKIFHSHDVVFSSLFFVFLKAEFFSGGAVEGGPFQPGTG